MDGVVQLGPLVIASDRLLAVTLILVFIIAMDRIAARTGEDATRVSGLALVGGIVVARFAFVAANFDVFSRDWWSVLALWQGGFLAWPGFLAAAGIIAWRIRPLAAMAGGQVALAAIGAVWFIASAVIQPDPKPMPQLPRLALVDGTAFAAEQLVGEPYVVNLWATWCPPCQRELPMLADAASVADVPILLVNQGESHATVRDYLQRNDVAPDAVLIDASATLSQSLENGGLPVTLFVDGSGNVVETHLGEISRAALLAQIAEIEGD